MKIALAQLNYTVGDVAGNTNKIIESVRRAKAEGADLVVFAEQAISGAPSFDLLRKNPFLEQCEDALMRIAAECDTVDAIVGLPILTKEGTISAAALIQQGRVVRYVGKQNITVRRELGFLTPSKGCEYVTIRGCRCALVVGDDLFHTPDFDKSVETVINIHARRYRKGDLSRRYDVIRNIAYVKGKNVVMVNQVGGAPSFDLLRKNPFLEQCEDALMRIAAECDTVDAIVGLPILTKEGTISAAALIQQGRVVRYVGKQNITVRRELGFLTPSKGCEYVTIRGCRCALVVGDDLFHTPDFDKSVETVINIHARRYRKGDLSRRYDVIRNIAYVKGKNVVMVNQVGGATELVYDGMSGVMDNRGKLVRLLKSFEEDFQVFDTENPACSVESVPVSVNDRTRFIYEAACCGLRDFFVKNGYKKACVGVSGGIDSAVVACLAVAALGAENVRGLMMPSQFSSEGSVEDAKQLAENLGIEFHVVPITEAYRSIVDTLIPVIGGTDFDATEENIQSRIRTLMLMALQNKNGYVLLNCSNKSENALGICTLYGDTGGAFSVTGDLYKTEMYDLARYINRKFGAPIPENILTKEPSSELRPNQKDSDMLPSYEVVDAILYRLIEDGQSREEIINAGFDSDEVQKIYAMVMRNEKKRFQYPPVLRLSSSSFGHEYRMPLTHKYVK